MTMNKEWGGLIINTGCSNSCVFCASKKKASAKGLRKQLINVAKNLQDFKKQGILFDGFSIIWMMLKHHLISYGF